MTEGEDRRMLLLYDGTCGFCHASVRFVIARDRARRFVFAPLQSPLGRRVLERHGRDPDALDSVVLVEAPDRPEERIHERSAAALEIAGALGPPWSLLRPLRHLPAILRDPFYALIARFRYRLFGRREACSLPSPDDRARFLDTAPEPRSD